MHLQLRLGKMRTLHYSTKIDKKFNAKLITNNDATIHPNKRKLIANDLQRTQWDNLRNMLHRQQQIRNRSRGLPNKNLGCWFRVLAWLIKRPFSRGHWAQILFIKPATDSCFLFNRQNNQILGFNKFQMLFNYFYLSSEGNPVFRIARGP